LEIKNAFSIWIAISIKKYFTFNRMNEWFDLFVDISGHTFTIARAILECFKLKVFIRQLVWQSIAGRGVFQILRLKCLYLRFKFTVKMLQSLFVDLSKSLDIFEFFQFFIVDSSLFVQEIFYFLLEILNLFVTFVAHKLSLILMEKIL